MNNKEIARKLGSTGGKKSAEKRLGGRSKAEISEIMSKVRLSKKEHAEMKKSAEEIVQSMRKNIK